MCKVFDIFIVMQSRMLFFQLLLNAQLSFQAKLETKALKAKRPGFTDERYNETSYYHEPENSKFFRFFLIKVCFLCNLLNRGLITLCFLSEGYLVDVKATAELFS